jgi:hypothetical protein
MVGLLAMMKFPKGDEVANGRERNYVAHLVTL